MLLSCGSLGKKRWRVLAVPAIVVRPNGIAAARFAKDISKLEAK
jgi:hypothetical protein